MEMIKRMIFALTLCLSFFCSLSHAQNCAPPSIVANAKSTNLFSPEQEMVFGELIVQNLSGELRFVRDEKLTAYIN